MARNQAQRRKPEASPWLNGDIEKLYNHYYSRLAGVAITRYKWIGLPDNCSSAMLEAQLVLKGGLAAFTHLRGTAPLGDGLTEAERGRFMVSKATYGGAGNMFDDLWNPSSYRTYGPKGGTSLTFDTLGPLPLWRGVPIWGDDLRMNYDGETIGIFASRLARAALIVDVNLAATTRGVVAFTDQDELLSTQTAVDEMLSGITMFTKKSDLLDNVKAVDFGVHPDTVERSHAVTMRLWNEALTALGVQAGIAEKVERHTDDEVQAIEGAVAAVRKRTLEPRKLAAQQINRRYFQGAEIVKVVDQW